ncbi:hypothetical protein BACFIN_05905, partial [Bacteroides finegoldii DSM 17565]
ISNSVKPKQGSISEIFCIFTMCFYFRLPPFWPSNRFLGGMLKDTKKATNSQ